MLSPEFEWDVVARLFRTSDAPLPQPWDGIFGPLRRPSNDGLSVVAQLGQSLDGRIATVTGHSHYINGCDGLDHLHRLRALVDAVVVGVNTVVVDNPQLTVRRVAGPSPARVIIDPRGRLPRDARVLADDGTARFVITGDNVAGPDSANAEVIRLPSVEGRIAPATIVRALAGRGMRRILIEGGGHTISNFLQSGCLDRLHIVIAPVIIGAGAASLNLPPIATMDAALRPNVAIHQLGPEILFDCDLSAQRIAIAG